MEDKREKLPDGVSLAEYVEQTLEKMPTSTLTYRETWALKEYLKQRQVPTEIGAAAAVQDITNAALRAENKMLRARYEYVRDHCLDGAMLLHRATPEERDRTLDALRGEGE